MALEWHQAVVRNIQQATATTRLYELELLGLSDFDFKPGQFITLDLPIHEKRNKRWRSYSIASAPNGTNRIELAISYLEGGLASAYIFDKVEVGTELSYRGPLGVFVLPEKIEHDLFLICTGTGVAPFRSMVQHLANHPQPHKNIHLIFGTRTTKDLLYTEELRLLQEKVPQFTYWPILSREAYEGRQGYVHAVYESLMQVPKPEARFMLCGWRVMIDEARERLAAMGYDRKQIHQELYG